MELDVSDAVSLGETFPFLSQRIGMVGRAVFLADDVALIFEPRFFAVLVVDFFCFLKLCQRGRCSYDILP